MATGRDDFVIAFRSAFLKKKDKQKFSLLSLILLSIVVIILSNINFKPIQFVKIGINEIIYRSSYIASKPENYLQKLNLKIKNHLNLFENFENMFPSISSFEISPVNSPSKFRACLISIANKSEGTLFFIEHLTFSISSLVLNKIS